MLWFTHPHLMETQMSLYYFDEAGVLQFDYWQASIIESDGYWKSSRIPSQFKTFDEVLEDYKRCWQLDPVVIYRED